MNVVLVFLFIFHSTAADFGLPVRIVPLLKTVQTQIGTGIQPLQSASPSATIPTGILPYSDLKEAVSWKALYTSNITAAIQKTNQALLIAVQDAKSGPSAAFDKLFTVMNISQRHLQSARSAAAYFEENYFGEMFSKPVLKLLASFEDLKGYITVLQTAAMSAAKEGTVTTQNVQKYISATQVKLLGDRITAMMDSVRETTQQLQRFNLILQQLVWMFVTFDNATQQTMSMDQYASSLKNVLVISEAKMLESIKYSNESINRQYAAFVANKSLTNSSEIRNMLTYLNNSIVSSFSMLNVTKHFSLDNTQDSTKQFIDAVDKSLDDSYGTIVRSLANSTLNSSAITSCVRNNSLVNDDLNHATYMAFDCINHLHRTMPVSRQTIERFLDILHSVILAPITEFNICTASVSNDTCLEFFKTQHFASYFSSPSPAAGQIVYVMAQTVYNNADYAVFRMQKCYEFSSGIYSKVLNDTIGSLTSCLKKVK